MNPKHYFSLNWGIYLAIILGSLSLSTPSEDCTTVKAVEMTVPAASSAAMLTGPSAVTVTVAWPSNSAEYKVEIYDPSDNLLGTICNPASCYTGIGGGAYNTTLDLGCLPNGLGYYVRTFDNQNDGWGGVNNLVSVESAGVEVMVNNGTTASSAGTIIEFEVSGGGATCCDMTNANLLVSSCNNEGTIGNTADDTFTFSLNPTGTILASTYSVSGDVTAAGISYGVVTTFDNGGAGFLMTGGDLNITITDDNSGSCALVETVLAPAACATCSIAAPTPQKN